MDCEEPPPALEYEGDLSGFRCIIKRRSAWPSPATIHVVAIVVIPHIIMLLLIARIGLPGLIIALCLVGSVYVKVVELANRPFNRTRLTVDRVALRIEGRAPLMRTQIVGARLRETKSRENALVALFTQSGEEITIPVADAGAATWLARRLMVWLRDGRDPGRPTDIPLDLRELRSRRSKIPEEPPPPSSGS